MTVRLGFFSWKPSLTSWIIRRSWSSQLLFFLKPACEWLKMPLASARWYRRVWIIRSMVFTMQEVRLTGRYDSIEPAGFPAFSKGMVVAFRQACGTSDSWSDWLKIPSNSPLARGPKAFRKLGGGGMSSGPAAPFFLIFLMALFSSSMLNSAVELSSTLGALPLILASLFFSLSSLENSSLLTLA